MWIDTHVHWDAPEYGLEQAILRRTGAREAGVSLCVVPAVAPENFATVRDWAHAHHDVYALGIHPMWIDHAPQDALQLLEQALAKWGDDPRLVAVGEIGIDGFVEAAQNPQHWERQVLLCKAQMKLAKRHGLPVILHVRKSVDAIAKCIRETGVTGGIAHAFNGSHQQAQALIDLGFVLGVGGAATFESAQQLRRLLSTVAAKNWVLETDGPDIPPQWLYVTREQRQAGIPQGVNGSDELPAIAAVVAQAMGLSAQECARITTQNALRALPRIQTLQMP